MKITEYTQATSFDDGDVLLKDGTNGTKIIKYSDAVNEIFKSLSDVMLHQNIYRGKNLGSSLTTEQAAAITAGTFKDLFIGDYWTINGVTYRIADFDYFYNVGDTNFTKHHVVIVPDNSMYSAKMNETNTTEGGYVNSAMRTTNLEQARTTITAAFGERIQTHRDYLVNAVTDGHPSGAAWMDSDIELMNEIMAYGCYIRAAMNTGNNAITTTTAKRQFALFRLNPRMLDRRQTIWLRDVVSSTFFAGVGSYGDAGNGSASGSIGVRPYFVIG